jgi:hypothetical protein
MNVSKMSNEELIKHYEKIKEFHTGCVSRTFLLTTASKEFGNLDISGEDIKDILWDLQIKAFNEIHNRFPKKL